MTSESTPKPQVPASVDLEAPTGLGLKTSYTWHDHPRRLLFTLAKYKFVAKILSGRRRVLEVGCSDGFATRIVLQEVGDVFAVDTDPAFVNDANERMIDKWRFDCRLHDMRTGPVDEVFEAAYAIDQLERTPKADEQRFISNIARSLDEAGVLIIGTPTAQSQKFASEVSRRSHINPKDHRELRELMSQHFENVFIFSMNDEVVHTGFYPMAHYLFALGAGRKPS